MAALYTPTYSLGDFTIDSSLSPSTPRSTVPPISSTNPPTPSEFFAILQGAIQSGLTVFSSIYGVVNAVGQDGTTTTQGGQVPAGAAGTFTVTNSSGQTVASGSVTDANGKPGWDSWGGDLPLYLGLGAVGLLAVVLVAKK